MSVRRMLVLLVAIFSAILLLSGRGWQEPAQALQSQGSDHGESENVELRIAGEKGTRFSGVCSAGEEKHDISGQAPKSFEYEINDDRQLTCEIRKQGEHDAALNVVLEGEDSRSIHRSVGGDDTAIMLTYQDGSVSSSMYSSSSRTTSGAKGDSSSPADNEPGGEEKRGSLADRIQKRVNEILERTLP